MLCVPDALRAALSGADEGYLVGLCNRGTVNRARKDLAGLSPAAHEAEDCVQVDLGDVRCTVRAPLGDSTCTCPSPAMCRHRIAAILWLQEQLRGAAPEQREQAPPPDLSPLLEVPVDQLRRAMGAKPFHALVFRLGRDGLPPIAEGSTVQVELPWEGQTVKLLLPLEHATCTCRSRELCRHKAAALLCYQLHKGRHRLEELAGQPQSPGSRFDAAQVSAAAQAVRELAAQLLDTGLSRLSPASPDSAQRLAALCHTAQFPRLESGLRALSSLLERALARSAAFRTEDLLLCLADLDHRARQMGQEGADLLTLAGTFRETYDACPKLSLALLGERRFHADSGYAGTIYYLWELERRQWYTYTVARPTFYDGKPRRPAARDPAPWGLDCLMDQLYGLTISLERGRATRDRRLSASEESFAAVGAPIQPWQALPPELCWDDFSQLARALEPHLLEGAEVDRVALVRPASCVPRQFDRTAQRFRLDLADEAGRTLPLEVRYRAEEEALVAMLERLAERLEEKPEQVPAFLGLFRLTGEGLSLYPIEIYDGWGGPG